MSSSLTSLDNCINAAIDNYIDMLRFNSLVLFNEANCRKGAFMCYFDSVDQLLLGKDPDLFFTDDLYKLSNDNEFQQTLSNYDPNEHIIIYISVCLDSTKGTGQGAVYRVKMRKNAYKTLKPIYDVTTGKEIARPRLTPDKFNDNNFGSRVRPRCLEFSIEQIKMSKCGRCKQATYCSKSCQVKNWSCHKNFCLFMSS